MPWLIWVLLAGLLPAVAQADTIYRWVDSQGMVHYGNKPPAKAKQLRPILQDSHTGAAPAPSGSGAAGSKPEAATEPTGPKPKAPDVQAQRLQELEQQRDLARLELLNAIKEYEEGKAVRLGSERNYVRYQDRVNALEERVRSAQERVLLLDHQIDSLSAGSAPREAR